MSRGASRAPRRHGARLRRWALALACTGLLASGCSGDRAPADDEAIPPPVVAPTPEPADACRMLSTATARALLGEIPPEPARGVEYLSGTPPFDTCSYAARERSRGSARVGIGMLPASAATFRNRKAVVAAQPWETAKPRDVTGIGDAAFVAGRAGLALVGDREVFVRLGGFTGSAPRPGHVEALLRHAVSLLPPESPLGVLDGRPPCSQVTMAAVVSVLGASAAATRAISTGTPENGSSVTCLWAVPGRTVHAQVTRDPQTSGGAPRSAGAKEYVEEVGRLGIARKMPGVGRLGYRATEPGKELWTVLVDDATVLELTVVAARRPAEDDVERLVRTVLAAVS